MAGVSKRIGRIASLCSILYQSGWAAIVFEVDTRGVVGRSDIVLERPNGRLEEATPLGNGRLGIAVWAQDGLTIQLNRADTLPGRLSPGQVKIPGLAKLNAAPDYAGRLDLYNGEFAERGGAMSATLYIEPQTDAGIVKVTGADPAIVQTVELNLWEPRRPRAQVAKALGVLSETWMDSGVEGASGKTFGSLAAVTVRGREARASVNGKLGVRVAFLPEPDGSFEVCIAAPAWSGGNALSRASALLSAASVAPASEHKRWWNAFWGRATLMKLSSGDGSAEYFENLRMIDLFTAAASSGGPRPGSQAGVADLFSAMRDHHRWDPAAYWHWNLRMQVAANLGAGLPDLNKPYFQLYRDNLENIEAWTRSRMASRPGACVPETMRFNGQGIENEAWAKPGFDCDADSPAYYNARTLSTGAEVSFWIWQQYLATEDRDFLAINYPVMAAAARFLLAYSKAGPDGLRHTQPSNAHENQWDVHDPTTDICAMRTLFAEVIAAAQVLQKDSDLAAEAKRALQKIPELPRTDAGTLTKQLTSADDLAGDTVIAQSYDQSAPIHNSENVGLEPVWPYGLIGDDGALHALGVRTYMHRPNKIQNDWSYDPLQAARLGLTDEVKSSLTRLTERYQEYPSGFANFLSDDFYIEQIGVLAAALQEALVQDYDDLLRIAPAWPKDWNADATLAIQRNSKVHVQVRHGEVIAVILDSGFSGLQRVRNPWPRKAVRIVSDGLVRENSAARGEGVLEFEVQAGKSYTLQSSRENVTIRVDGVPALHPKRLGKRSIGLTRSITD